MTEPVTPHSPFPSRRQVRTDEERAMSGTRKAPASGSVNRLGEPEPTGGSPLFPGTGVRETTSGLRSRRLEHERARTRKRRRRRRVRTFVVLLVVLALLGGAGYIAITVLRTSTTTQGSDDYPGPGTGSVEVTVEKGDAGSTMGQKLVDADVVRSVTAFVRSFEANQAAASIKPGTYTLKQQMTASDAVAALLDDTNRSDNTVTINAGQTAAQITDKLAKLTNTSSDEVEAAMKDSAAIGLPSEANGNVEGWLCPGSYEVSSGDTPATVLSQMVAATISRLDKAGVSEADRETVLIKASILEREMNITEYLPQVARVIENRLDEPNGETKGLLQMDSTVQYGLGKSGGVPSDADYKVDTPYNTYIHTGLPPAPIAQPSDDAIEATLHPADGDWLYFVTVDLNTGETLFATTHDEQEVNVAKFNQFCSANPGVCGQ